MIIKKRLITEKIKMSNLFSSLKIKSVENTSYIPDYIIKVNTPYGFKNIKCLFRTENQPCATLYFSNGKKLKTSLKHQLKVNGDWCKVEDIILENDIIESKGGITFLKKIVKKKNEILYDISVEDVHCYYSNDIVSHNSWSLQSIGLHALTLGKNVMHFTMELNAAYTGRRYDSRLIGVAAQNLKYSIDEVKQKVSELKGRLLIQYYPTKTASVVTLKSAINKAAAYGFIPDMIIVDYADLLKSENINYQKQGSYYELGSIYEELRGMAGEYQVPLWTASQANKSAESEEIITGDKVSESYKKVMTADFILSVSRRIEDKLANTARWHVIKNRYGPDALTFPSRMDTSIGRIEIFAPQSAGGTETRKDMRNSNELMRKELANRFGDFE